MPNNIAKECGRGWAAGTLNSTFRGVSTSEMAERQQRQRLRALRDDPNLARFVVEGTATGKQLGTGSYGSVEEVSLVVTA